jgi:hypothetical protein
MSDHRCSKATRFEHDLIHRAIDDDGFRKELIADATSVVKRELVKVKGKLADNAKVFVLEETPTSIYIVLPPKRTQKGKVTGGSYDPYNIAKE